MSDEIHAESSDSLTTIRTRLTEAVAWFELSRRGGPGGFPRTTLLAPHAFLSERPDVVRSVVEKRARALGSRAGAIDAMAAGRLLGYSPDDSLSDGAAEVETQGFYDVDNEPPWDFWLGYVIEADGRNYLVSWIPEMLIGKADRGIEANPESCIFWLVELERILT